VVRRFVFFDDYKVNIEGPEHGRQLRAVPIMNLAQKLNEMM
jgi:hypothetical protein